MQFFYMSEYMSLQIYDNNIIVDSVSASCGSNCTGGVSTLGRGF